MSVLAPHDPDWARQARAEADRWHAKLGSALIAVHHIGSTAIPGIAAKPILDLLPLFHDLETMERAKPAIVALGYEWLGAYGLPGRRYCRRDDPATGRRLVQAHAYVTDDPEATRHLAFRDYLRADPARAAAYEAEKRRCAQAHPEDIGAYSACKSPWIKAAEARALKEYA